MFNNQNQSQPQDQQAKPQSIGGVWIKSNQYGEYLSLQIEMNGQKLNFVAYANKFKSQNEKAPDFKIMAPRDKV